MSCYSMCDVAACLSKTNFPWDIIKQSWILRHGEWERAGLWLLVSWWCAATSLDLLALSTYWLKKWIWRYHSRLVWLEHTCMLGRVTTIFCPDISSFLRPTVQSKCLRAECQNCSGFCCSNMLILHWISIVFLFDVHKLVGVVVKFQLTRA